MAATVARNPHLVWVGGKILWVCPHCFSGNNWVRKVCRLCELELNDKDRAYLRQLRDIYIKHRLELI